jgi:hypothetical protein
VVAIRFGVRVQSGVANVSGNRALAFRPLQVNINPVTDTGRAFLLTSVSANIIRPQGQISFYVRSRLANFNTLEFARGASGLMIPGVEFGGDDVFVSWQVIEYED